VHMRRRLAEHDTVCDAVVAIFDAYVEHLDKTDYVEGCAVASVALDAAAAHEELADATSRAFRDWVGVLAEAIEAEGRSPAEAHGLATLVIAAIEGTVTMAKGVHSTEPVATARDQLRAILSPG